MANFAIKSGNFEAGKLATGNTGKFIQELFVQDPILAQDHFVLMDSPRFEFLRTFFEGDILGAGSDMHNLTVSFADDTLNSDVNVATILMEAAEYRGKYVVPHKYIRQNIEREGFVNSISESALKATKKNMARLAWHSNKATGVGTYKLQDGFLKLANKAVIVEDLDGVALLRAVKGQFDTDYVSALEGGAGAFYVTRTVLDKVKEDIAARETGLGDAMLADGGKVFVDGIEVIHSTGLNDAAIAKAVVLTVKENLKYGVFMDIKIDIADDYDNGTKKFYPIVESAFGIQVPKATLAYVKTV